MKITWNLQNMQVCCVWFVDLFRTHKEIALHLDKIVDVHGIIPSNHNVSWGLYFHHCRRSGFGDFLLYLWDSWNATREKEHLERLWDRNLGQQFLFWVCGRHWAISLCRDWGNKAIWKHKHCWSDCFWLKSTALVRDLLTNYVWYFDLFLTVARNIMLDVGRKHAYSSWEVFTHVNDFQKHIQVAHIIYTCFVFDNW